MLGAVRLHLHEWGDAGATPVVCLHGVTGHGGRFRRLAERLGAGFRVVAPDLRGHGRSGWEPPWNLETHVADLVETIEAAGLEPPLAWVGHSFGGRLIMELSDELVARAVLLDPVVQFPAPVGYARADEERADKAFASPEDAIEARYASGLALRTPREIVEEEVAAHLAVSDDGLWRYRYSQPCVVALFGELCREPPELERRNAPALLVVGSDVASSSRRSRSGWAGSRRWWSSPAAISCSGTPSRRRLTPSPASSRSSPYIIYSLPP